MRRLRDFESIVAMLSEQEIDEMQAVIDARHEARAERDDPSQNGGPNQADAAPGTPEEGGRRAS